MSCECVFQPPARALTAIVFIWHYQVTLEPKLTESALFALVETSSECMSQLPKVDEGDEAAGKIMDNQ